MLPLGYFLVAWLILLMIQVAISLFTLSQMLKYGSPSAATNLVCFFFIAVMAFVIIGTGRYLIGIDWNVSVSLIPQAFSSLFHSGVPTDIPLQ